MSMAYLMMASDASTHGYSADVVAAIVAFGMKRSRNRTHVVALSGLQGSGKSTLAAQVVAAARAEGIDAVTLSIDDFYFGSAARMRLARTIHPLLITRGVPGTHDVALALRTLDALRDASPANPARLPRFDKGLDTRVAPSRWRSVSRPPRLVVFEGWCVGVPPQKSMELKRPLNALERDDDAHAIWRTWVNDRLSGDYQKLWRRFDRLAMLQAPSFAIVSQWRDEQERALRERGAIRALSPAALRRFLMHYERLSRQALKRLPALADLRIVLDRRRRVRRIVVR
ncbi:MAG: kinase [Rudaea sp.]